MFGSNAADFTQVNFNYGGLLFAVNNKMDVLNDPGPFTTYKQISYILSSVLVENITDSEITVSADYPLAGQQVNLGTVAITDFLTATQFDLNCSVSCSSLSGSDLAACNALPLCPDGASSSQPHNSGKNKTQKHKQKKK
jgi:hypothetical protein